MVRRIVKGEMLWFFICMMFFSKNSFSEYIEGIDTMDAFGYGLDSSFQFTTDNTIKGQNLACYVYSSFSAAGAFNYSFDDIKFAADSASFAANTFRFFQFPNISYCFVVKKNSDSTYVKVQVLQKLSDFRIVFKYGTNTSQATRCWKRPITTVPSFTNLTIHAEIEPEIPRTEELLRNLPLGGQLVVHAEFERIIESQGVVEHQPQPDEHDRAHRRQQRRPNRAAAHATLGPPAPAG